MKKINLMGDVVPGERLAGIDLGDSLVDIDISDENIVNLLDTDVVEQYGWIPGAAAKIPNLLVEKEIGGVRVPYFLSLYDETVCLSFNEESTVNRIVVGKGYEGKFLNEIGVGSYLNDVLKKMPLEFNTYDDIYLSKDAFDKNNKISEKQYRIGFLAPEVDEEEIFSQVIEGFTVF